MDKISLLKKWEVKSKQGLKDDLEEDTDEILQESLLYILEVNYINQISIKSTSLNF